MNLFSGVRAFLSLAPLAMDAGATPVPGVLHPPIGVRVFVPVTTAEGDQIPRGVLAELWLDLTAFDREVAAREVLSLSRDGDHPTVRSAIEFDVRTSNLPVLLARLGEWSSALKVPGLVWETASGDQGVVPAAEHGPAGVRYERVGEPPYRTIRDAWPGTAEPSSR